MSTPSGTITEAQAQQYNANFILVAQQRKSRFESRCRTNYGIVGASKTVERIGATAAQLRTTRNGDSPLIKTPFDRRWIDLADYEWGDLIDDQDKLRMIADPNSAILNAGLFAMNRSKDDVIIAAMRGSARAGTGSSATTVALPAAQKVAVDGTKGLTVAKLINTKEILTAAEAYDRDNPEDKLYIAVSARQITDLLGDDQLTSADYNTVKALVKGEIDTFMGFEFVPSERLASSGTSRYVMAWCKSGMDFGMGADVKSRLSERSDKSYAMYAYACMSLGAVRNEDEKVVEIACYEAP